MLRKVLPGSTASRMLLFFFLFFTLPGIAHAWYVNAKANVVNGQGTVSPAGTLYVAGTTGTSKTFTVTPVTGSMVARATLDNLNLAANADGTYTVPYNGKSWRYLVVYFGPVPVTTYDISVSLGAGGALREANGYSLTNVPTGASRTLLFSPNYGYRLDDVQATGATPTDNGDGTWTVYYASINADQNVSATFERIPVVTAHAGSDVYTQGNGAEFTALLDGSQSSSNQGAISYSWSGPPELAFGSPDDVASTVYSDTAGTYTATLTITSGGVVSSDTAQVNVPSRAAFLEGYCTSCHTTRDPEVITAYDLSAHKSTGPDLLVACQTCHDPTGNRHYSVDRPVAVCQPCHATVSAGSHGAEVDLADQCVACHNPHSGAATGANVPRHFDGAFGGNAQYVAHGAACADCHANNIFSANADLLDDFAASGHADVASPAWASSSRHDWPNQTSCRRCHTRVGYVDDLTGSSTIVPAGEPGQILACNACHETVATAALRASTAVAPGFTSANGASYPDARDSNLCVRCHAGRTGGSTIKDSAADFSNVSFINSHYLAAAETLFRAAYEYAGQIYTNGAFIHNFVGNDNGGPCIHCHMTTADSHLFAPVAKDETTGDITAITSSSCSDCHNFSVAGLNVRVERFQAAMEAFQARLALQGIYFGEAHPYFFTAPYDPAPGATNTPFKDWESVYPGRGKEVMGAAFNFNLLRHEPGAWVHNSRYTRRLIYDSMDFLTDGALGGFVGIDALVGNGIDQSTGNAAKAYLDSDATLNGVQRP